MKLLKVEDEVDGDEEDFHQVADSYLLEYIDDEGVTDAFRKIPKWYS